MKSFPYISGRYCNDSCRKVIIFSQLLLPEKCIKFSEFHEKIFNLFLFQASNGFDYLIKVSFKEIMSLFCMFEIKNLFVFGVLIPGLCPV